MELLKELSSRSWITSTGNKTSSKFGLFKCKYCKEIFDDIDEYGIHLRNHRREIADEYNMLDEIVDELIDGFGKFAKKLLMRKQMRKIFKWFVGDYFEKNIYKRIK